MKTLEEKGVVTEVRKGKARVRVKGKPKSECKMGCKCCEALGGGPPVVEVEAEGLETGDEVMLRIERVSTYLSMIMICGLPITLFIVGYLVGQQFGGEAGQDNPGLLGAIIGLIVAVLIAWVVNRTVAAGHKAVVRKIG